MPMIQPQRIIGTTDEHRWTQMKSRICLICVYLCASVVLFCANACDQSTPAAPIKLPPPTFGPGVIRGTVTLAGPRPAIQRIHNMPCCADSPEFINDETVVADDHGHLANVVVFLTGIPASDGSSAPPVLLDQKFCQYKPHVLSL